jgi:hypothetical protein
MGSSACDLTWHRRSRGVGFLVLLLLAAWAAAAAPGARAAIPPEQDPFYKYEGRTPLKRIVPGIVLKTRTVPVHIEGIELPLTAVQLLYRSTSELGTPTVNVTSVLLPPVKPLTPTVLSYQSFYDSLSTEDDPSYAISGGDPTGGEIPQVESVLIAPALLVSHRIRTGAPEAGRKRVDHRREVGPRPHLGSAGQASVPDAGNHPGVRAHRKQAHHGG